MLDRKKKLIERNVGGPFGSLLDIGAGTGYFLHYMREHGWMVKGTEKSAAARAFADQQWNMELLPEEGLDTLPEHSFDAVTLWHVMEHLYNLDHYWERLVKLLKKDGCLLIALPNPESWDSRHFREYWAAWDVPRHLWHFSPENIVRLAGKYGFRLRKTLRMPFDAFYVSILSEKYRKSGFPVLKGLFWGTVSWLSSMFNIRKSSSLIYVFAVDTLS
jgi:SAM-dependent methyltransferase